MILQAPYASPLTAKQVDLEASLVPMLEEEDEVGQKGFLMGKHPMPKIHQQVQPPNKTPKTHGNSLAACFSTGSL